MVFLFFLISGHKYVGNGDAIDFQAYFLGYQNIEVSSKKDFWFYYLFYSSQKLGHFFSFDFYQWWACMTFVTIFFIIVTFIKRRTNPHLFLFFFMMYYIFLFYGGLKFYYGFVVFQYAFSFYLKEEKYDKYKYILFTMIAGGFHVMYYIYLPLILIKSKLNKRILITVFRISILTTLIFLLRGRNMGIILDVVNAVDNDRISIYFSSMTKLGFLLPISIHLCTLYYIKYYIKLINKYVEKNYTKTYLEKLYYANLLVVVIYLLFIISLTFMRVLTALSLTSIIATSYNNHLFSSKERTVLLLRGLPLILMYYYINMYLGGYIEYTVLPLFDSYYFK